jgi:branched-subunit amino acid transport protein
MPPYYVALILAALGTITLRYLFLGSQKELTQPRILKTAMEFLPISILAALVFQTFFLEPGPLWPRLVSGIVALALAWILEKDLLTILAGLVVYGGCLYFT